MPDGPVPFETAWEISDPLRSGGAGPAMVVVPPGNLRTGCWPDNCPDPATTAREFALARPFALSRYEVTRNDFLRFAAATGRSLRGTDASHVQGWPVVNVSWHDAAAYADWLATETNRNYRLPREAEWEYAARAGGFLRLGQSHATTADWSTRQVAEVGSGDSNAWGFYDMHGNVSEWVFDCADLLPLLPGDGEREAEHRCASRIRRGSSWIHPLPNAGAALRMATPGSLRSLDTGFRVALDVE